MMRSLVHFGFLCLALGSPLYAQQLRLGVARANYIVVARQVAVQPLEDRILHRFEILDRLKGEAADTFTITVPKRVADVPAPALDPSPQFLCLRPTRIEDVPERFLPVYRLTGYRGDRFIVDDSPASQDRLSLVRTLIASENGETPDDVTDQLVDMVLTGRGPARLEASEALRGRMVLRDSIPEARADRLLLLAIGSEEDSALKCSIARLVVEGNVDNALQALCAAVHQNDDDDFAITVGKLAHFKLGEAAASAFDRYLERVQGAPRERILLAIGATRTDGALERLQREWSRGEKTEGLIKALRTHGSEAAKRLIESR